MAVSNIPTRYALVKRMEVLLKQIDDYFQDADEWGLPLEQSDPHGQLMAIRKGLIQSLEREGRIRRERIIK